jgi:TolA-binding protein
MSHPDLPPLPAAIERLLGAERAAPPPPPAIAARVFHRVSHSLGWPAAGSLLGAGKGYLIAALIAAGAGGVLWGARKRPTAAPPAAAAVVARAPIAEPAVVPRTALAEFPVVPPAAPAARTRSQRPVAAEDSLSAESAMLLAARRSLSSGDAAGALVQLRAHARRWPRGTLEQEREILLIQSLVRQGEAAAAGARARRFLRRFPDSTLADTAREHAASE